MLGNNLYGQLGNGSTTTSLVPVQAIAAGSGATSIAAASSHICAVVNGGVQCWGNNSYGQLGNGSTTNSPVPVQAIVAGSGATSVAAGGDSFYRGGHTCAVVNGGVQCWGYNSNGQLGNGSTIDSLVPVHAIAAGSGATSVAAGDFHTCAVVDDGVQCWGYNGDGRLGNGSRTQSLVPVQAIRRRQRCDLGRTREVITAARLSAAACSAGVAVSRVSSATGAAAPRASCRCRRSPREAALRRLPRVFGRPVRSSTVACSAGGSTATASLATGAMTDSPVPVQAIARAAVHRGLPREVGTPARSPMVARLCWGDNDYGQLGNGSATEVHVPVPVIVPGGGASAVAAGAQRTCAAVDGGVQCWGTGQLGNGTATQSLVPVQEIAAGSGATSVATGSNHTCAVVDGGVQCWGYKLRGPTRQREQRRTARWLCRRSPRAAVRSRLPQDVRIPARSSTAACSAGGTPSSASSAIP
jgi:hypothetical protein